MALAQNTWGNSKHRIKLQARIGKGFGIGKLGKAEVMIQQAIPNCIEASSLLMAHRIYSCISFNQSCFRLAHHHSAIAHALTQRQAPQGVALVYDELNLMAASTAMGDYDNAYAHLKQIRHITADKPPKITADLMIKVDANEGLLLLKTARFAESEAILLKAQQQAKQLGCRSDEVWIAGRLIDLCCQQSRLDLAQSYAESYWKLANQYQLAQQMLDIGQLMIKILLATNDLISVEAWLKTLAQQTTDTEYFRYKVILKLLEAKWHIANSEPMQAQQTIADLDALLGAHSEPLLEAIEVAQLKQDLV